MWQFSIGASAREILSVEDIMQDWLESRGLAVNPPSHEIASGDEGNPPPPSQRVKLCRGHPDIDETLKRGGAKYTFPSGHPLVDPLLAPFIGGAI